LIVENYIFTSLGVKSKIILHESSLILFYFLVKL